MMEIRAKARRLRQRAGLKLMVIDYLKLMTSGKKFESRQQEVSELSRNLKLLAKELGNSTGQDCARGAARQCDRRQSSAYPSQRQRKVPSASHDPVRLICTDAHT